MRLVDDGRAVLAGGQPPDPHPVGRSERVRHRSLVRVRELAHGPDAERLQPLLALGADAPERARRQIVHHVVPVLGRQPEHALRLGHVARDLGAELVVTHADGAPQSCPVEDRALHLAREPFRLVGQHLHERLVPAGVLHHRGERPERCHHLAGGDQVVVRVDRQEDGVGALLQRGAERHAGTDPERARFVRRRRYHAAFRRVAVPADHDRSPGELRPAEDLDRRDELIEIDVEDEPLHPPRMPNAERRTLGG